MGGVLRIADLLQYVPMLYGLAIGVHLEDVNTSNPTVLRVVVEQIYEMDVCPDIVLLLPNSLPLHCGKWRHIEGPRTNTRTSSSQIHAGSHLELRYGSLPADGANSRSDGPLLEERHGAKRMRMVRPQ
jgi:hypothetical protein